ncbi:hypothetical protein HanIR_Chr15g0740481 [Helianthus annuus]|nr:hypothetical protein HanIR_Chr15g0740481 [Helianthus annuus]
MIRPFFWLRAKLQFFRTNKRVSGSSLTRKKIKSSQPIKKKFSTFAKKTKTMGKRNFELRAKS